MKLEHFGMAEPGDCRVVFSASAEELEAAVQAEKAAPDAPQAFLSNLNTYQHSVSNCHIITLPHYSSSQAEENQTTGKSFMRIDTSVLRLITYFCKLIKEGYIYTIKW